MRERARPARIGLFGGTFNPIHVGHLRAAEEAAELLDLERVVFLPSADPPHKGDGIAPPEVRLAWVQLAVADNPRFEVDAREVERPGPSYSVDTLRSLRDPSRELVFLIGEDAFREIGSWKEPETVLQLAHFAVFPRRAGVEGRLTDWLPAELRESLVVSPDGRSARHRRADTWLRWLHLSPLDVSATELRRRLRAGRTVRYLVPEAVRQAILESGFYSEEAS
jgi:nicotinate-nucleotide adenylyltransferase